MSTATTTTTTTDQYFQGVVCCCFDSNKTVQDSICKLLNLTESAQIRGVTCFELALKNKYYEAKIQLFDYNSKSDVVEINEQLLVDCHAIVLYASEQTLSVEQLEARLKPELDKVQCGPRILLCDTIEENSEAYKDLRNWCITNGYDLLLTNDDDIESQLIDSLSSYKWTHRTNVDTTTSAAIDDKRELDGEFMKKLMDFDSLLNKLSAYRERPELRGDPNDKNIEEIAGILSGLLGDDVDKFLESEALVADDTATNH